MEKDGKRKTRREGNRMKTNKESDREQEGEPEQ